MLLKTNGCFVTELFQELILKIIRFSEWYPRETTGQKSEPS